MPRAKKQNKKIKEEVKKDVKKDLAKDIKKSRKRLPGRRSRNVLPPSQLLRVPNKRVIPEYISTYRGASPEAARIAAYVAMPEDVNAIRFSDEFTDQPTALNTLIGKNSMSVAGSSGYVPASQWLGFFFRDPVRNSVQSTVGPFGGSYNAIFEDGTDNWVITPTPAGTAIPFVSMQADNAFVNAPHGDFYYPGIADTSPDLRFFWIDSDGGLSAWATSFADGSGGLALYTRILYRWTPNRFVQVTGEVSGNAAAISAPITIGSSGYYAIKVVWTNPGIVATPVLTISGSVISITSATAMAHRSVIQLQDHAPQISGFKVTAHSARFTNTSAQLYRDGQAICINAPKGDDWLDYSSFDDVAAVAKTKPKDATNGAYTFLTRAGINDIEISSDIEASQGVISKCCFRLRDLRGFVIMVFKTSQGANFNGTLTDATGLEYTTASQWVETKKPSASSAAWREASEILKGVPTHTENPFHFGKIFNSIQGYVRKGINFAEKYGPSAMKIAKLVAEM